MKRAVDMKSKFLCEFKQRYGNKRLKKQHVTGSIETVTTFEKAKHTTEQTNSMAVFNEKNDGDFELMEQ